MKKVILALGLDEKSTEDQVVKAIEKIKADHEAQCAIGAEYSSYKPQAEAKIKELTDKIEKLTNDAAVGQISQKKIKALVKEAFDTNKDVDELWGTGDGHLFKEESQAKDHKSFIGGPVKHYTR